MAHASQAESKSVAFKEVVSEANTYLLPRLISSLALKSIKGKSLTIFYPGCGFMPGLNALITSLARSTDARTFKLICVDMEDDSADIIKLHKENQRNTSINEFSIHNFANDEIVEWINRSGFTPKKKDRVKVNIEYHVNHILPFLKAYKGEKVDFIFLENPPIDSAPSPSNFLSLQAPISDYRSSFSLLANIVKSSGTQIAVVTETRLELNQARLLLDASFSDKKFSSQTVDLMAFAFPTRPYRNFFLCEAYPHFGSENHQNIISGQNVDKIKTADNKILPSFALISAMIYFMSIGRLDFMLSTATLLLALSHGPLHRLGKEGVAVHAGLVFAQLACFGFDQYLKETELGSVLSENSL